MSLNPTIIMTEQSPNSKDLDQLVENYVTHIVDNMDIPSMEQLCYDLLQREYEKLTWDDITEEIVDLYDEDTLIELLPDAQWDLSSLPSLSLSAHTSALTLSTPFQTFKMQNYKNSAKSIPPSQQIVQRYYNVESDGDWDDILSPDDIEEYYERRQYEKMMRR